MQVGALATTSVLTVRPGDSLKEVAQRMSERNVGAAAVMTDDGSPGIITERDLMRAMAGGADTASARVEDFMTANAITASESWSVGEAARTMIHGRFRHLLVLGPAGEIMGILSIRDLVESLLEGYSEG
jgi:CBS domain-containing protein